HRDGCLICLVQASASMRNGRKSARVATKLDAALHVVDQLVADLVQFAGMGPADSPRFDVGVLAYSTNGSGRLELRPLLPGSTPSHPLVPLSELGEAVANANGDRRLNFAKTEPRGDAPAGEALAQIRALLAAWTANHAGAIPPIILHCTDGK